MRTATVRPILAAVALGAAVLTGGCGEDLKKENEQLKGQVSTLQKENADLKGQVAAAKAEADKVKQEMEAKTKELEAKVEELQKAATRRAPAKGPAKR